MISHCSKLLVAGLLCAALAAGGALYSPMAQAQAKPQYVKKPRALSLQPRPDLLVEKVWMGKDCRIRVVLSNAGKAPLPPKIGKLPALSLQPHKGKERLFTFDQVDPKGKLAKPGGKVVFIAPRFASPPKWVVVLADPKKRLAEASENNNQGKAMGPFRQCRVAEAKLPVAVFSAYLKKGVLHLRLISARKFKPDRKKLGSITLKVQAGAQRRSWTLAQVDPTGRLRLLHRLDVNTRLKIRPGSKVHTLLKWPGGKREKGFTLAAQAPTGRLTTSRARPRRTPEQVRTMVTTTALAVLAARGSGRRGGVYMSLDSGIHISRPREGQEVPLGSNLRIRYRFLHDTPAGTVTFTLMRGDQQVAQTTTEHTPSSRPRRFHRYKHFTWDLPSGLERGDNYRLLITKDDMWSLSDPFKLISFTDAGPGHQAAWEMRMVTPGNAPVSWPRGATKTIAWRIDGEYPETRNFMIRLMRGGARVLDIEGTPRWFAPAESYSLSWTIPPDLPPASDYRIWIADRNGPVEVLSNQFTVTGPIEVLYPGTTRYISNPTRIRWRLAPDSGITSVRIVLYNQLQGEVMVISRGTRADAGEFNWRVAANFRENDGTWKFLHSMGPLPQGGGYTVRVMDSNDHSNFGESMYFRIEIPVIRVWTSESNCRRGVRVHWEAPQLHADVRVRVAVRHHWYMRMHPVEDPYPGGNWGYTYISESNHPTGNFCWKFGEHTSGSYPPCCNLPCPHARVVVWPRGFRWISQGSSQFEMDDRGCDDSDPVWEGIW